MKRPIQVIVLEDDTAYTQVLRQVFADQPDFEIRQSFYNPLSFLGELPELEADVFLLDINLPKISGVDCIGQIREFKPESRILMLTLHADDDYILRSFLNGANGYLLKDSTPTQIFDAIRDSLQGGAPMSSSIARKVVRLLNRLDKANGRVSRGSSVDRLLTTREKEILECLANGKKYAEIAKQLFICKDTVKTHIHHIYEKLQVRNKTEAISKLLG